jgi:alkane 1-monooxygenase
MSALPFCLAYLMPLCVAMGYHFGGKYTFLTPFITFVIIPILDLIIGVDQANPSHEETEALAQKLSFRLVTILYLPIQTGLIIWGAHLVNHAQLSIIEWMGLVFSVGIMSGGIGITIAHELSHKKNLLEQTLGKILLLSASYMHFYIEHNLGHHVHVCTPKDPATARFGESFYRFYPRTVIGSFRSAWKIELGRLQRTGYAKWSWRNQMLWFIALPILFAVALGFAFGWKAPLFFFAQSFAGFSLLELVNYLEHYGLERQELAPGHYEKVTIMHAWNTAHRVTNYFLFKLQRHADHHVHPVRRYQTLRTFDESPQLPAGYPTMILLALVPPLWRRVMDPRVRQIRAQLVN